MNLKFRLKKISVTLINTAFHGIIKTECPSRRTVFLSYSKFLVNTGFAPILYFANAGKKRHILAYFCRQKVLKRCKNHSVYTYGFSRVPFMSFLLLIAISFHKKRKPPRYSKLYHKGGFFATPTTVVIYTTVAESRYSSKRFRLNRTWDPISRMKSSPTCSETRLLSLFTPIP